MTGKEGVSSTNYPIKKGVMTLKMTVFFTLNLKLGLNIGRQRIK
jgi:hypothetical protein